ncbi:hypothetical protein [Streptomyces sp. x-80]|uniref:hypothetical protein n=1 Tax=Streptomyces sp. x-80 TaxID=2789282 RepID=UPI00398037FF
MTECGRDTGPSDGGGAAGSDDLGDLGSSAGTGGTRGTGGWDGTGRPDGEGAA